MSKLNAWKFALLVCLVSSVLLLAQAPRSATAPRSEKTKPMTAAEVETMTAEVLKQVSEIRGLKLLQPVKSGAKSRAEIEQMKEILQRLD